MKTICKAYVLLATSMSISLCIHADAYNDRLIRLTNLIANEYDAQGQFIDPEDMTAAAFQVINFITVENNISKNNPLGKKNKYITINAETLKKHVVELLKLIQKIDTSKTNNTISKDSLSATLKSLGTIKVRLEQLEGEIEEIPKKQFLPRTQVQKDLITLLALLTAKNLALTKRVISNLEFMIRKQESK